jgi:7-cyano-7-deazaguanine synthase
LRLTVGAKNFSPLQTNLMKKNAVILLSGGLDSATTLFYALSKGYDCHCLLFSYGQRHRKELLCARRVAKRAGVPFQMVTIKLPWSRSSLTDAASTIPSAVSAVSSKLPTTYVPGRNTIFISFALSYAESIGAEKIFIGANAVDYSGYPDCRPEYYNALNKTISALKVGVRVETPLIKMTKEQIITLGLKLKVPYELTWSCYAGGARPCGMCDSCRFRAKGFARAGIADPSWR